MSYLWFTRCCRAEVSIYPSRSKFHPEFLVEDGEGSVLPVRKQLTPLGGLTTAETFLFAVVDNQDLTIGK